MNILKRPLPYLLLSLALLTGGCEKSADLGRIQEETLALVKQHGREVDLLQRRADALMARGRTLGGDAPGIADAGRLLSEARSGLDQLRAQITAAPATVGNAAKTNLDELLRVSDDLVEKVEKGEVNIRSNLAAVDSWLMSVENRPAAPTAPPPPPAGNESPNPPVPATPETGSGTSTSSAAGSTTGSGAAPQK